MDDKSTVSSSATSSATSAAPKTKRVTLDRTMKFNGRYYGPGKAVEVPADFPDPAPSTARAK